MTLTTPDCLLLFLCFGDEEQKNNDIFNDLTIIEKYGNQSVELQVPVPDFSYLRLVFFDSKIINR